MKEKKIDLRLIISIILVVGNLFLFFILSLPYLIDKKHETISDIKNEYIEGIGFLRIKLQTQDAFMANNPINFFIEIGPTDLNVEDIQINFIGAEKYFSGDYNCNPLNKEDNFSRCLQTQREKMIANNLRLKKDFISFSGNKSITYNSGGDFPLEIVIGKKEGNNIIYGNSIITDKIISNAPPETKIQIKIRRIKNNKINSSKTKKTNNQKTRNKTNKISRRIRIRISRTKKIAKAISKTKNGSNPYVTRREEAMAAPVTKLPSTVRSGKLRMRYVMNTPNAAIPYSNPCSVA